MEIIAAAPSVTGAFLCSPALPEPASAALLTAPAAV